MKNLALLSTLIVLNITTINVLQSQNDSKIPLSEFNLSNNSSPAFVLVNETPTEIYIPENLKALTLHVLNNFDGNISVELTPYYFLNRKSKSRSFKKYIGIEEKGGKPIQKPFSGTNTTTISFAYANKEFENLINENRKVFSLGLRTKLFRLYNTQDVNDYSKKITNVLKKILLELPDEFDDKILEINSNTEISDEVKEEKKKEILSVYFNTESGLKHLNDLEMYKKPLKPFFQIDASIGYSSLFEENKIDSKTLNRFGAWLTSEFSLILNKDSDESKSNNYINLFLTSRYIEDEFNLNENTFYYRDFGGKIELELGKFSLGYEYIDRNGSIDKERSVGTIKYLINKNISLNGGFGKDFSSEDNLVTLFGINWGINTKSD